jgi:hypothetical protein
VFPIILDDHEYFAKPQQVADAQEVKKRKYAKYESNPALANSAN